MKMPKSRNVFVLCTGRNGSASFARACQHFSNYTAGHETRVKLLGDARVDYPPNHIEADNRLSWFLGRLDKRFGDDAVYVHLRRNPEAVAESYNKRWNLRAGIVSAYATGIAFQSELGVACARDMVRTVEENILCFLKDKSRVFTIDIETVSSQFTEFATEIGAKGELGKAVAEFAVRHNSSGEGPGNPFTGKDETSVSVHYGMVKIVDDYRRQLVAMSNAEKSAKSEIARLAAEVAKLKTAGVEQRRVLQQAQSRLASVEKSHMSAVTELKKIKESQTLHLGKAAERVMANPLSAPFAGVVLGLRKRKFKKLKEKSGKMS